MYLYKLEQSRNKIEQQDYEMYRDNLSSVIKLFLVVIVLMTLNRFSVICLLLVLSIQIIDFFYIFKILKMKLISSEMSLFNFVYEIILEHILTLTVILIFGYEFSTHSIKTHTMFDFFLLSYNILKIIKMIFDFLLLKNKKNKK